MGCEEPLIDDDDTLILSLSQVPLGFLPIRGSTSLFPNQSARYPRGIAEVTG